MRQLRRQEYLDRLPSEYHPSFRKLGKLLAIALRHHFILIHAPEIGARASAALHDNLRELALISNDPS